MILGIDIISSELCVERIQFRFPRSKKSRIRNKWKKNDRNFKRIPKIFKMGDTIIAHPSLIQQLKKYC
jgi:hypothetical protein